MKNRHSEGIRDIENENIDQELFDQCLKYAEGDNEKARKIYIHRRTAELEFQGSDNLDSNEKWPMLTPLLVLYTLGTVGVLILVFWFLSSKGAWQ
tara:strand:+ start:380 stop:664 length:285 start_codon:yes stop_codon:yes gene_type:complete